MTRRRLWAVAVLAAVVAAVVAGYWTAQARAAWWQQLCDAQTAMDANGISLGAVAVTGQDPQQLQQRYQDAANAYAQAAQRLHLDPNQPSTECQP